MNAVETVKILEQLSSLVGEQTKLAEKQLELAKALEKDSANSDLLEGLDKITKEKNALNQQVQELEKKILG